MHYLLNSTCAGHWCTLYSNEKNKNNSLYTCFVSMMNRMHFIRLSAYKLKQPGFCHHDQII